MLFSDKQIENLFILRQRNKKEFASKESLSYWKQVDMYIGGTEHAVGHLLYSRMWNKF